MLIAGVNAMTIAPHIVEDLKRAEWTAEEVSNHSLFLKKHTELGTMERKSFIDDEAGFRHQFGKNGEGKGETKTKQVRYIASLLGASNLTVI